MIYNNKGGKIGFSSSKKKPKIKKLFTPIKLSIPILSDIKNYREKSLPNSSRKESNRQFQTKIFPSQSAKTTIISKDLAPLTIPHLNYKKGDKPITLTYQQVRNIIKPKGHIVDDINL